VAGSSSSLQASGLNGSGGLIYQERGVPASRLMPHGRKEVRANSLLFAKSFEEDVRSFRVGAVSTFSASISADTSTSFRQNQEQAQADQIVKPVNADAIKGAAQLSDESSHPMNPQLPTGKCLVLLTAYLQP
jgi:hypothetical protein